MTSTLDRHSFVAGGAAPTRAGSALVPATAKPASASFLVVGDWGREGGSNQRGVGIQMSRRADHRRERNRSHHAGCAPYPSSSKVPLRLTTRSPMRNARAEALTPCSQTCTSPYSRCPIIS